MSRLYFRYINPKMHISMYLFSKPLFLCEVMGMLESALVEFKM